MPTRSLLLAAALLAVALGGVGCAVQADRVERLGRGPRAQELFIARSFEASGREPDFDERRMWEDRLDERVSRYLREHPDLERAARYSDFRFWRQVSIGSARDEVRALLDPAEEETVDAALMAALAERHWPQIQGRAKEAWVYPLGWVLFFDDQGVVDVVRRVRGRLVPDG